MKKSPLLTKVRFLMPATRFIRLAVLVAFFLFICTIRPVSAQIDSIHRSIDVNQADSLITAYKDSSNFTILDVRTEGEFASGRIEGAINQNYYGSGFSDSLAKMDKHRVYLVYCQLGGRSNAAFNKMRTMAFEYVYNMRGGLSAWINAGYPISTGGGTGIDNRIVSQSSVLLYPNPISPQSEFYLPADAREDVEVIIFNSSGQWVDRFILEPGERYRPDFQRMAVGLYVYRIFSSLYKHDFGMFIISSM